MERAKEEGELQGIDHEIVLSLDANEDTLDDGQFTKFIKDNDLVDVYHQLHPQSNPATYLRGHQRLNYMFLTPGLTPALRSIGYLPIHTGDISSSIDPETRKLKATHPKR
eukprot:11875537-Ditylum_brightwellii.AAC.1